jgi:hypothetical protein
MMEAVRTSETSVDNHFTRQYIPEDNSEHEFIGHEDIVSFVKSLTIRWLGHFERINNNNNV